MSKNIQIRSTENWLLLTNGPIRGNGRSNSCLESGDEEGPGETCPWLSLCRSGHCI